MTRDNNNPIFSVRKKDLVITYFSGKGGGGQHRNKHQNCVRIKHKDTGIIVTGQSHKERKSNIKEALNNLSKHPKFKIYCHMKINEIESKKSIDDIINEWMKPENLKIEYIKDGVF